LDIGSDRNQASQLDILDTRVT